MQSCMHGQIPQKISPPAGLPPAAGGQAPQTQHLGTPPCTITPVAPLGVAAVPGPGSSRSTTIENRRQRVPLCNRPPVVFQSDCKIWQRYNRKRTCMTRILGSKLLFLTC